MYKRILVPVDGSDASQRGLQEALALAKDHHATLHLLYVVDASASFIDSTSFFSYDELVGAMRNTGQAVLGKGEQLAVDRGVSVTTALRESTDRSVAPAILAEAQENGCDLIVMGTHGRRGLSHLVLGSDAESVLRSSPLPVLLVRPQAKV